MPPVGMPMPREGDEGRATPVLRAWQEAIQTLREQYPDAYAAASRHVLAQMQHAVNDPLIGAMRCNGAMETLAHALGMSPCDPDAVVAAALLILRDRQGASSPPVVTASAPGVTEASITVMDLAAELGVSSAEVVRALVEVNVMVTFGDTIDAEVASRARQEIARCTALRAVHGLTSAAEVPRSERERLVGELVVLAAINGAALTVTEINDLPLEELTRRVATLAARQEIA